MFLIGPSGGCRFGLRGLRFAVAFPVLLLFIALGLAFPILLPFIALGLAFPVLLLEGSKLQVLHFFPSFRFYIYDALVKRLSPLLSCREAGDRER